MALPVEKSEERMHTICKTYLLIRKRATAKQIAEFINFNNFGLKVTSMEVSSYLSRNIRKDYQSGRGCLRNCYGFTKKGKGPREYYIDDK